MTVGTMTFRRTAEWLALLLCVGSFATYLYQSLAVATYLQMYATLLGKPIKALAG